MVECGERREEREERGAEELELEWERRSGRGLEKGWRWEAGRTWGRKIRGEGTAGGGVNIFELESEEREASCFDDGTHLFGAIRILYESVSSW